MNITEYHKLWRRNNPNKIRGYKLHFRYGLTQKEVDEQLDWQDNKCYICGTSFSERRPVIDHNHVTNVPRGILCDRCNLAIGLLNEDPKLFSNVIEYLKVE
jgi:hypothetical protein